MLTAQERGDLAERLLRTAAKISVIAHGEGDWHDIDWCTHQLDRTELIALIVALGAMVDPDQLVNDALGYVTWDENLKSAPATDYGRLTVRGLVDGMGHPQTLGADAVLDSERRLRAKHLYLHDGLTIAEVARAVRVRDTKVTEWAREGGWRQVKVIEADVKPRRRKAAPAARSAA